MPEVAAGQQHIFYQSHGIKTPNAGRPPLILVHGAGGMLMTWPPDLRRLPQALVYALDLPGHGKSRGTGLESIPDYSNAVLAFADALNLPRFVFVGHSMGSAVAMEMALRRPDRLAGMVLVGANADLSVAPSILAGLQDRYEETCARLMRLMFGPEADPTMTAIYLAHWCTLDRELVSSDFTVCDGFDRSAQIHSIRTPTLIICGADDKMAPPAASRFLHEQIVDSRFELIENAGHMVMLEKPQAVASTIADFLSGLQQ